MAKRKHHRRRHARRNPLSSGAAIALVAVVGVAAVGGYYLYKKSKTPALPGGGGNPPLPGATNHALQLTDFTASTHLQAKVGDTITVNAAVLGMTVTPSGGIVGGGSTFTVNGNGALTANEAIGTFQATIGTVTVTTA